MDWSFSFVGFFHFFIEDFMRLALVYDYLMANPHVKILTFWLRDGLQSTAELFEFIGINRSRLIQYSQQTYKVRRLLVPSGEFHCQITITTFLVVAITTLSPSPLPCRHVVLLLHRICVRPWTKQTDVIYARSISAKAFGTGRSAEI